MTTIAAGPIAYGPIAGAVTSPAYQPEAVLSVTVAHPTYAPAATLEVRVAEQYQPQAVLGVNVLGAVAYAPAARWRPVVRLGGVDVSAALVGTVTVEAEEGAARLADFTLRPASPATLRLPDWVGQPVEIDYAHQAAGGAALHPVRVFTGVVDLPEFDPVEGTVAFTCTDNRQQVLSAMSRAQLAALIGGQWSAAVFDDAADPWRYAADRLSTVAASLDLSAMRTPRLTPWAASETPWATYTEAEGIEGTVALQMAPRSAIHNRVRISYRYRYPRLKRRRIHAGYNYPFSLDQIMIHGYGIPSRAICEQALQGTGWTLVNAGAQNAINHDPVPGGPIEVNLGGGTTGLWAIGAEVAQALSFGFGARLERRYVQSVEEVHSLDVRAEASIAALGSIAQEASGSLGVEFDAGAWESNPDATPQPTDPVIGESFVDHANAGIDDRAASDAAIETLVAIARAGILAGHRATRVQCAVVCNPFLDLTRTVRIEAGGITAQGKLAKVAHVMDMDVGTATTELAIAVSSVAAVGLQADTPIAAADPPAVPVPEAPVFGATARTWVGSSLATTPENDGMVGFFTNVQALSPDYSASAPVYESRFSFEAPAIEDDARRNLELPAAASYAVAIPQDTLEVTV